MRTIALLINPPPRLTPSSFLRSSPPLLLPVRRHPILTNFRNPYKTLTSFFSQNPFSSFLRREMEAPSPLSVHVKEKIDLTDKERQIFDRLLHVVRHFNLRTQLRVAGGWVRDKLLGKECHDIDIALDNMLGREFCEKVNDFLISAGEETKGFAVIQRNPDQSKHLETARMHLFDMEIDFVNLRSEDYSENSRIPTMKFGTAEEDAYRRDLTINSLFYNINSSSVEDFTGRGLADLKSGRIVTPLPPKETFLDDPLRVLRAIRFGARFQFILDTELKQAASCDDVKTAIANKISRERIGQEIDLMIKGNHPVRAMTHIYDLSLFWVVFCLPTEFEPATPVGCDRLCITYMGAAQDLMQLITSYTFNDGERRLLLYSALLLPLRDTTYKYKKAKMIPVVDYIFRNSLKLTAGDIKAITQIHIGSAKFVSLIPYILSDESIENVEVFWKSEIIDVPISSKLRVYAGLLLGDVKGLWRVALLMSILLYPTKPDGAGNILDNRFELDKRKDLFTSVENVITKLDLEGVAEDKLKPLVNGKDIISALELKSASPVVGEWHHKLHQWQLAHPLGSREECLDWLKENYSKRFDSDVRQHDE